MSYRGLRKKPPAYPTPRYAVGDRVRISESSEYCSEWRGEVMIVLGVSAKRTGLGYTDPEITYHISNPLDAEGFWSPTDGGSDEWSETCLGKAGCVLP